MVAEDSFITIQAFMRNDLHLENNELIIYAIIFGFSNNGNGLYNGSQNYLAEWAGISLGTVKRVLNNLEKLGLIRKEKTQSTNKYFVTEKRTLEIKEKKEQKKELLKEVEKKNSKTKKETVPLLEREPKNDLEKIEKKYLQNYKDLYGDFQVLNEKPVINWTKTRKLEKDVLEKYGFDNVYKALKYSKDDKWIVKNGYLLSTILSSAVLAKLINANKFGMGKGEDEFDEEEF